ncbi:MAG: PEP-CTERM sorting domain-containing protein [Pelovirga sp.]
MTDGITSAEGGYHANVTGAFTPFDGYRDTWPGSYTTSLDVYLDTSWASGSFFEYTVASSNSVDGGHLQDFVFHVAKDDVSGGFLLSGDNNAYGNNYVNTNGNYATIGTTGWYTLQHFFYDDGGVLAVDMSLLDALGTNLFTETRTSAANTIPDVVGGNRYGWFASLNVDGGLNIDNSRLDIAPAPVPEPSTVLLLGSGLLGLGWYGRKRKKS